MWIDVGATAILIGYYLLLCLLIPVAMRKWLGISPEVVRKTQHMAYAFSIFIQLQLFTTWYWSLASAFVLVILGYPALKLLEKGPQYRRYLVDRSDAGGELRRQLLYVQFSFALLIFLFWGLFGPEFRYLAAAAVMTWGFGDAAAALVGRYLGRRNFSHRLIERAKTVEGTKAMMVAAFAAMFLTLLIYGGKPWFVSLAVALLVAPVAGLAELFSKRGTDTLTVPVSAAAAALPLILLFSAFGW